MSEQWRHRLFVHRIAGEIAVLGISLQQSLSFQKVADGLGKSVRQLREFGAAEALDQRDGAGLCSLLGDPAFFLIRCVAMVL